MNTPTRFEAIYKKVSEEIEVDNDGMPLGEYAEHLEVARRVTKQIGTLCNEPWPAGSTRFLDLAVEVALCTLIADRQQPDSQPGLQHLLRSLGYEAAEPPLDSSASSNALARQRTSLEMVRYSSMSIRMPSPPRLHVANA